MLIKSDDLEFNKLRGYCSGAGSHYILAVHPACMRVDYLRLYTLQSKILMQLVIRFFASNLRTWKSMQKYQKVDKFKGILLIRCQASCGKATGMNFLLAFSLI